MKSNKALRHIIEKSGLSHRAIAERLDKTPSYVSVTLARGSVPKADTYANIADACGYDLKLVSRDGDEEILIDPE